MEIFQKSASTCSSKDPAKNKSKLTETQPCLTSKILFVCPMVPDSRLPYFIHWRTVEYICSRGNNCLFRLEYRVQKLIEHTLLAVLFLSNLTRLTDVPLATTSEVLVSFLIGQYELECLRIQTNFSEETALVPETALYKAKQNRFNLLRVLLQCYWQETDG